MKTKQTAVEWLIYALTDNPNPYLFLFEKPDYMEGLINIIQQAKQMEKEQIVNAFISGDECENLFKTNSPESAEEYYNKTYGKSETKGRD